MWRFQMPHLTDNGFRAIGLRPARARPLGQPRPGLRLRHSGDDLGALLELLDLTGTTLVGHSMGGGEIVRYLTRHGADRVEKIVLIGSTVPCLMRKADTRTVSTRPVAPTAGAIRDDLGQLARRQCPAVLGPRAARLRAAPGDQGLDPAGSDEDLGGRRGDVHPHQHCRGLPGRTVRHRPATLILHGEHDASAPVDLCARVKRTTVAQRAAGGLPNAAHALYLTHRERLKRRPAGVRARVGADGRLTQPLLPE